MLIRQPEVFDGDFTYIKRKIDADYNANQSIWQIYWTESMIDVRLEAGDTTLMAEVNANLPNNNRGQYYFNRTRPLCSMVSGRQRQNRKSTIVVPIENGDQETADQWTKILMNIYKREGVDETISDAFHQGACITGMNLLHAYLDFRCDPISGDLKVDNLPFNSFFIDPYFRKPDLSDCNFVWRRTYVSHSTAASLMPDSMYEDIMALPGNPTGTGRDGRFQYLPESYGQTQQNRLAYDEYWYRDYRQQTLLVDEATGEKREVDLDADNFDLKQFMIDNPTVKIMETEVPTVRLAIMIQDKVFYDGPNPLGIDRFPFVAVVGYYNSMMPYFYTRIQGLCRSLRDPQMLLNRRIILSADMLESQVNSGFIFKENAIVDVKHLFQTGQGRIIPVKADALITDIQPIQPPQIPPSFFQLQETFSKELSLVTGINEELMGMASDAKAGITEVLRQGAGLVTLQPLFDKLDAAQKQLGELVMDIVRHNYTPGKIKSMLEGQEPAPLFYNKAFGEYHCIVEQGFNTDTQKQMQMAQLLQLRELGVPIPDDVMIEAATIQNKTKLTDRMAQQAQQAQQMQQQQMQLQMQEMATRAELQQARAMADRGLGLERVSRVEENKALAIERQAEARKDDEEALLNFVKAVKEIQSIDINSVQQMVQISQMLKQMNEPASQQSLQVK